MRKSIPDFLRYAGALGHPYVVSKIYQGKEVIGAECSDIDRAWRAVRFESSTGRTPEFAAFARAYRSAIRKQLAAQGLRLVKFSTGHFYCSWFAYNPEREQYCYGSCPDVRYWPDDWFASILVRHAKHDKDYTGGANHYATLGTIGVMASDITKRGY